MAYSMKTHVLGMRVCHIETEAVLYRHQLFGLIFPFGNCEMALAPMKLKPILSRRNGRRLFQMISFLY